MSKILEVTNNEVETSVVETSSFGNMELTNNGYGNLQVDLESKSTSAHIEVFSKYPNNKAAQMRYLASEGYNTKAIFKIMSEKYNSDTYTFIYQHVYNTLKRQLKK